MSPEHDHPVDRALRQVAGTPQATDRDRQVAEQPLREAIRAERSRTAPPRYRSRRLLPAALGAAAVLAAVVGVVALSALRPSPAQAALGELAEAARAVDPLRIPPQSFAYTRSEVTVLGVVPAEALGEVSFPKEHLAYLLPQTREVWVGAEGAVQIRTTTHRPRFFSPEDETAYYQAGLDRTDRVGETVTETVTGASGILEERDWPTDPVALARAMREALPPDPTHPEAATVDLALDLLRETRASPALRGAVLEVLASLDLELIERRPDVGGRFALTYGEPPIRESFVLDGRGHLLGETEVSLEGDPGLGIPPGTAIFDASYEPAVIVRSPEAP